MKYNLTAIVLVYNGQPYLEECLESLANQTIECLEILLINDASTDNSLEICREFERQHDNAFVIDKKTNSGLASSANLGIETARGKYVTFVDNDDVVPPYAYERLFRRAEKTGADISVGKAHILEKYQREMNFLDNSAWQDERIISDLREFPQIFHDVFYWNKIIRRDLLVDNNITMPEDIRIYADRCFVHRAYVHAGRISVIPDCVYMWRKRPDSLSRSYHDIENFTDRMDSYCHDLDYLSGRYGKYFNTLFRRALIPVRGILKSREFEDIFFERFNELIGNGREYVGDIYDNDFDEIDNICTYLIINNQRRELRELLKMNLSEHHDVLNENGKSYWKLPQFRNPKYNIPDELFEIRHLQKQFVNVGQIASDDEHITFKNIEIPRHFNLIKGEITVKGLATGSEVLSQMSGYFEIEKIRSSERNIFTAEVPIAAIKNDLCSISFKSQNCNGISKEIRLNENFIAKIENNNEKIEIFTNVNKNLFVKRI